MEYAKGAGYDSSKECMRGTRRGIIQEIIDWVNVPDSVDVPRLCWLSGLAGTGKSAIAHTVARIFDGLWRLGSSFFFDASIQQRRIDRLFSSISVDLADLDGEWKRSLWEIVKGRKALRTTSSVSRQFTSFILDPAKVLKTIGPIVIVIDALDESGDEASREELLQIISSSLSALPLNFRVLVTSRPEPDIEIQLGSSQHVLRKRMEDAMYTKQDIERYIGSKLTCFPKLDEYWPNRTWLQDLVESSEGLFQWAFAACRFVKGDGEHGLDPVEQLTIL